MTADPIPPQTAVENRQSLFLAHYMLNKIKFLFSCGMELAIGPTNRQDEIGVTA